MPSNTTRKVITYEDLSLVGLIEYFETKRDSRSKMVLTYLKDYQEISDVFHTDKFRARLNAMSKHPRKQELEMKRIKKKQAALPETGGRFIGYPNG